MSNEKQEPKFVFETDLPSCETVEQMKAVMKCRFQRALDAYFDVQPELVINESETVEE